MLHKCLMIISYSLLVIPIMWLICWIPFWLYNWLFSAGLSPLWAAIPLGLIGSYGLMIQKLEEHECESFKNNFYKMKDIFHE